MNKKSSIIEPELSYKIVGLLFKIHTALGPGYQEKHYQKALEVEFKNNNIKYKRELRADLIYNGEKLGRYFLDFLVEDKIVLELKTVKQFSKKDIGQLLRYLREMNLKLGMLVNFRREKLEYKRIINNQLQD